ncbi:hypothetical protein TH53_02765 [Pedobacter lusitanus]|uniref:FecR protein n=1 Tax=Pedobacter lusitanus TaxID=1503925 RepID=A0A0D0GQU5_9SPHI|nr:FecR family protein [Pedobacter lusitanus]KIO78575.1 hypothetical protein TH53_02765 [Pedobacter lusitanus]
MDEEELQSLLKKYVDDRCTDEEKALLETWFLRYEPHEVPELTENEREQDLSAVWNHLETESDRPAGRSRLVPYLSAAAILLLSGLALFFYRHNPQVAVKAESSYANDVPSGKNKAYLTLGNGKKVSLNDAVNGNVIQQEGAEVIKTGDGLLVYKDKGKGDNTAVPNTVETPQGGQWQLNLPDGTRVWLNSASRLTYPSTFSGLKTRRVTLSGEAYFEVTPDKSKPFIVITEKQVAEVLGTHFNINSYSDEPATKTTLLEGAIKVSMNKSFEILKPGQEAAVSDKISVAHVDTDNAVAWKNGDFIFGQQDFRTTMRQLSRWYNIDVVYDDSAPDEVKLHGWISRSKSVVSVLKVMELTGEVHFKVRGRRVVVTK